jgi:hypothetical protein
LHKLVPRRGQRLYGASEVLGKPSGIRGSCHRSEHQQRLSRGSALDRVARRGVARERGRRHARSEFRYRPDRGNLGERSRCNRHRPEKRPYGPESGCRIPPQLGAGARRGCGHHDRDPQPLDREPVLPEQERALRIRPSTGAGWWSPSVGNYRAGDLGSFAGQDADARQLQAELGGRRRPRLGADAAAAICDATTGEVCAIEGLARATGLGDERFASMSHQGSSQRLGSSTKFWRHA